jgi:PAS domain S-box-containing protein
MTDSPISAVPSAVQDPAERCRQLFEDAPVAYHEIDTEGVIREVNQAECQLLGYASEELIGHPVWEFVAADHRQASRDAITRKLARQQPVAIVTREYRRSDGSYLWLEIREKLIENAEGKVVGIRSALIDVTERRKLEAEILRQRDWMRFVFRSVAKAVITADILGHISTMNRAAETITGWREEEAQGRPMEKICRVRRDSGEAVDLMSCVLAESAISNRLRNFVVVDRFGASQSIRWTVSPILNDEEVIVGAMLEVENVELEAGYQTAPP